MLVTRPAEQADEWVAQLRSAGIDAVALPLIGIHPPGDPSAVVAAWAALDTTDLVVFVSPNAVRHVFAARPAGRGWPVGCTAAAPGPGTREALRAAGVPADAIAEPPHDAAQFDSESLWGVLGRRDWTGRRALIARGEDGGRDWLAARLTDAGARVDFLAAYRRGPPQPDAPGWALLAAARAAPGAHAWWFSSSEAIGHLADLVAVPRGAPAPDWAGACAIATHPRIAERARAAGFGHVAACLPTREALVACIESLPSELPAGAPRTEPPLPSPPRDP
ncbi:uroporphyrinogen-III synthase [Piscinibacter sakaiensis]|uniref:Uroporphyrinogen-III synthase n=1 Tax=Piscinibacter sakaiensis TaxID=1547922 RepID=A0A0K8P3V6_PISS1|nr:uroporphyrinogen-III synthase [Piscinibacter sakaiensis]GAP37328.1 uroporphyrinogen-III synthase [Piscinibacter sakaiensis]